MEIICQDAQATEDLGRLLGRLAHDGDVYCLSGDLGAGKTVLCRGIAQSQGVAAEEVTSPTFALMNIYRGQPLEIRHFDLYRLNDPEELADMGFYEYAGGPGLTLIEWADLFASELPEELLQIVLTVTPAGRRIQFLPKGRRYEELCREVEQKC